MSVDVFGRKLTERADTSRSNRGPPGEGFKLTADNQYNIDNKRLCNIGVPRELNDATSLKTVKSIIKEETHALYQSASSLRHDIDHINLTVHSIETELQNSSHQRQVDGEKIQEFLKHQSELIFQLTARIKAAEVNKVSDNAIE